MKASGSTEAALASTTDEWGAYEQCLGARPLTSAVAVVDARAAGALGDRPVRSLVLDLCEEVFERAREGRQVLVSAGAVPESRPNAGPEGLALGMSRR
jgi:hypothetical protein